MSIVAAPIMWRGDVNGNWDKAEGPGDAGGTLNFRINNGATATAYREASAPGDVVLFADTYNGANPPTTTNITVTEAVTPAAVTVNNSAVSYTFGGTVGIGGTTSLTKSGTGSLTLNNPNTYTGGTNFTGGTLNLGHASAIGNGALTIGAGSAKTLNATAAIGAVTTITAQNWNDDFTFTGSNDLDMGNAGVTLGGAGTSRTVNVSAGTLTVGEVRGTAHGLVKQGSGTLIFTSTGPNGGGNGSIVSGPLTVSGGTVQMNRTGAAGGDPASGDLGVGGLSGSGSVVNGASDERWLFVNNATGSYDFSGTLNNGGTGVLGFVKQGAGTQKLSGANTYSGPTRLQAGTLILANSSALGATNRVYLGEGANANARTLSFATDSDNITPALVFGWGNTATVVSDRATPGPGIDHLVTTDDPGFGDGTITFTSGPNVTSGMGSISFIQVNLGAGQVGEVTTFNPTSANVRIGGISKAYVDLSATVNFGGTTAGNEVIDVISNGIATGTNNVSIIKSNTSTWTLSGANTYTGNTSVLGGTLSITNPYLADTADVLLANGANFNLNFGGTDTVDSLYINNVPQAIGTWGAIGSGAAHQTALITGTGILQVTTVGAPIGVPGDYNSNGVVDAADYVVWRKNNGTTFQLANEVAGTTPGQVTQEDYTAWRARFGNTSGSGSSLSGAGSAVPEPSVLVLACAAAACFFVRQRSARHA
ncbi:MAG: autotransporter-associated beta strand repeat-containing protein [Pirellulales bacterium]